jgi:hypothetical protein
MAQDLTVNIKTTSDVPQAMDRAKTATVSFSKQVDDIGRKFSTAFKDIAFSLVAPVVLLNSAISYIQGAMEQARRDAKEGLDLIAQGESRFASSEEAKAAAFFKRKKEIDDEKALVIKGREEITKQLLKNEGGQFKDFQLPEKYVKQLSAGSTTLEGLASDKEVQRMAMDYFTKTDAGKRIMDSLGGDGKSNTPQSTYSAPQGVNAVVGMGNNAAMDAMTAQLEENRKQTMLLEQIAGAGSYTPPDFTKPTSAAPSRSAYLKK